MSKHLKSILIFLVIFTICFAAAIPVSAADEITYTDLNNFKYDSIYFQAALTNTVQNIIKFDNSIVADNTQRTMNEGLTLKVNQDIKFSALFRSIGVSPLIEILINTTLVKVIFFISPLQFRLTKKSILIF